MSSKEFPEICIYIGESIDGKGSGEMLYMPENRPAVRYYFQNEYTFGFKSILMGRATFEEVLVADKKMNKINYEGLSTDNIDKKDFLSELRTKTDYYYITIDKNGKLPWPTGYGLYGTYLGRKTKTHIITILSEDVDKKYLAYLQKVGVSYIFAGEKNIDLKIAMKKLKSLFGIEKLMCQGGPKTNELLLKENLVQKLIVVKMPVIAQPGALSIFGNSPLSKWTLESFKMIDDKNSFIIIYNKKE